MFKCLKKCITFLFFLVTLNLHILYCVKGEKDSFIQMYGAQKLVQREDRYDSYIKKIYKGSIKTKEFTMFAHELLQDRIDHWKKELKKAHEANNTEALHEIPLYIILNPGIQPEEMLSFCAFDSEGICDGNCVGFTDLDKQKNLPRVVISKNCIKKIVYLLFVLHHELTHVEQWMNADFIRYILQVNLKFDINFIHTFVSNFTCYTNKEADDIYSYYKNNNSVLPELLIPDDKESEQEADKNGIKFFTNPFLLSTSFLTHNNDWSFAENLEKEGYLSKEDFQYYIHKSVSSFYKDRMETLLYHDIKTKVLKKNIKKWNSNIKKIPNYFKNRIKNN